MVFGSRYWAAVLYASTPTVPRPRSKSPLHFENWEHIADLIGKIIFGPNRFAAPGSLKD